MVYYTKLEKNNVYQLICEYDVKSIKEVKTSLPITLSGYKSYTSDTVGSGARGGTAVLVSNLLSESVFGVDTTSIGDEVWMQIGNIPGVLFFFFLHSTSRFTILYFECLLFHRREFKRVYAY